MADIELIHPIYLDVPMLASFVAAMDGGLSYETELTNEKNVGKSGELAMSGSGGIKTLFASLFDLSVNVEASGSAGSSNQEIRREFKSHTEASIAILLYDKLRKNKEYLNRDIAELSNIKPGALIEISGTLVKNAVDSVIDFVEAVNILSQLDGSSKNQNSQSRQQDAKKKKGNPNQLTEKNNLENIRDVLDNDRKRTPISNVILLCDEPSDLNAVITLRTENLRDLTLSELHKNKVRVVGKVTRIIEQEQSMSAFENYGLALLEPSNLENVFKEITQQDGLVAEFSEVVIKGPAVQILPLMVFV